MDDDARPAQTSLFDDAPESGDDDSDRDADSPGADPATRSAGRSTFALGRTHRRTTEVRVVEDAASPISGPFRVKAVVRDRESGGPRTSSDD